MSPLRWLDDISWFHAYNACDPWNNRVKRNQTRMYSEWFPLDSNAQTTQSPLKVDLRKKENITILFCASSLGYIRSAQSAMHWIQRYVDVVETHVKPCVSYMSPKMYRELLRTRARLTRREMRKWLAKSSLWEHEGQRKKKTEKAICRPSKTSLKDDVGTLKDDVGNRSSHSLIDYGTVDNEEMQFSQLD